MKNTKKFMNKKILIFVAFLAIIVVLASAFVWQGATFAYAQGDVVDEAEEKVFSTATIDEDFVDDTVVVILSRGRDI